MTGVKVTGAALVLVIAHYNLSSFHSRPLVLCRREYQDTPTVEEMEKDGPENMLCHRQH